MASNIPDKAPIVVIGAGKIGRGFIAHQLYLGGLDFVLADSDAELIAGLRSSGEYYVHVIDAPEKSITVRDFGVLDAVREEELLVEAISRTSLVFTSVGAANLTKVGATLSEALKNRGGQGQITPLNVVVCENAVAPSETLRQSVETALGPDEKGRLLPQIGIADSVVLRTGMDPLDRSNLKTPWDVDVQDYSDFPIDGSHLVASLPQIPGVRVVEEFHGLLPRKLYTSNCANATLAYLGYLRHHTYLSDAAKDPLIREVLSKLYREIDDALAKEYGVPENEKHELSEISWSKLNNEALGDTVERNARDPLRKLGPTDRLVGAARIVMRHGVVPESVATGIAAALFYADPSDPSAMQLRNMRTRRGVTGVLQEVSKIGDEPLRELILGRIEALKERGVL